MRNLALVVACQAGWFACVSGAAAGMPYLGPGFVLLLLIVRLAMRRPALGRPPDRRALVFTACGAALLGVVFDGALVLAGVLRFTAGAPGWPVPIWMIALWVNLALVIDPPLAWLARRPVAAAIAGAAGGPTAYFAGARLGALTLGPDLPIALTAVAIEWAIGLPLLLVMAARVSSPRAEATA